MDRSRLDPRAASALAGLLAGAARVLEPAGVPSQDAVPGLGALMDTTLAAVADVAGPDGVARVRERLRAKIDDGGGATTPRT